MATATKPKPDEIYVCIQSFAGNDFAVAEGKRLRGDNEFVQRFPDRFVPADTPDDEIAQLSAALNFPRLPAQEQIGRVLLRVLPGQGSDVPWARPGVEQTVNANGRVYYPGEVLEAEGANAQHLIDSGCVELVRRLRPKKQPEAPAAAPAAGITIGGRTAD